MIMSESGSGYKFYKEVLGSPKFVVAPMVDQSELAWRILCRRHGVQLCYTPMLHADVFSRDATYRKESLQTCDIDKPLIAQFCANKPETFLKSCELVAPHCVGVDLNLGCPQSIARRGYYGAFLQENWDLVYQLINTVHTNLPSLPITVKIRILETVEMTVEYAKMIEKAGAQILTVHGRTRDQRGPLTGIADWKFIKAVKQNVNIPVFANGNIQMPSDVSKCMEATGVDGVMSAEGNLHNPHLFESSDNCHPTVWDVCLEYIELVKQYPCPMSFTRAHIFKLMHHCLPVADESVRQKLGTSSDLNDITNCVLLIKELFQTQHSQYLSDASSIDCGSLVLPAWICQPYYRPTATCSEEVVGSSLYDIEQRTQKRNELESLSKESGISKTRLRKLKRQPHKLASWLECGPPSRIVKYLPCECGSPIAQKCAQKACKKCCRQVCTTNLTSCQAHRYSAKARILTSTLAS